MTKLSNYAAPQIKFLLFAEEDVITTSGDNPIETNTDDNFGFAFDSWYK